MAKYTKEDIKRIIDEQNVAFIRLQFTDVFGNLKNVAITASHIDNALNNKCMFDGSSIDGFARIEESDMCLHPDLDSFLIFPWNTEQGKIARLICDVYRTDGTPFEGDPRYVLRRAIKEAADMGYSVNVGPECEFFLFQSDENDLPTTLSHEKAGYFDLGPVDLGEDVRRDTVITLEEMGFDIEASHHECAPAQHEIDFKYDEALPTADNVMTFKLAVRTIANKHGQHATFMPKPKFGMAGSGMHLNLSLSKDGENIFQNAEDEYGLSQEAYYFIGGVMKHMKGMTAIMNPLVNSYKRLVPGYEAPVHIAWSAKNRSPLIRVPAVRGAGTRIEIRNPDPSANPYLAIAVAIHAGLDGIKNKITPPAGVNRNIFEMTAEERKAAQIESLPDNLLEAVEELEKDELVKAALGGHIAPLYVSAKKREWKEYASQVTAWELDRYLYKY
ncbi:MAG: type I glutamate--ammonia ligase [Lachnospiraceae bacterium]|nr:type I glutamate--ammonia ligase [Lachnospiraceae bacterium]